MERVPDLLAAWPPEAIQRALEEVLAVWGVPELAGQIHWRWNARLRTTVGRAVLDDMLVELNPRLLARHPEELRPVLVHEAGHLVAHRLHRAGGDHGPVWKALMRRAGESPRATHNLDTAGLSNSRARRRRRRRRLW